jgi:erythromycin esterase
MTMLEPRPGASDELNEIAALAMPLADPAGLDPLLDRIGDARYVLLGEASHGTADYYRWRAAITRRLIAERGFSFVAVEGDWPACFMVNAWAKGRRGQQRSARHVLGAFERWPTWMWANEEVAAFVAWLRVHNLRTGSAVGFYGLDVYSLWESLRRVLSYLTARRPAALDAAMAALACFEPYGEDPQRYAWATRMVPTSCEDEVVDLLVELHRRPLVDDDDPEAELDALQNAEVLVGAERYYRTMVRADGESWNVRDCHMADTLDRLVRAHGPGAKAVVWEHNTHVGDARATDMAIAGMVNVGQVVRERHERDGVVLVGFGGHRGSVVAAEEWGAPMRSMPVPPAPAGTHEALLSEVAPRPALLVFGDRRDGPWLSARRGHRAIGVVYRPERDRSNWVPTEMGRRYDAFLSFADTEALRPLHLEPSTSAGERETYPWST